MDPKDEQRLLEESLKEALEEAWAKANTALEQVTGAKEGFEKAVWLAMESADYTSLLFSLTNDLEDIHPALPTGRAEGTQALVKESVEALRRVRESAHRDKLEAYKDLREAVRNLRTAHLGLLQKPRRQGRT